MNAEQQRLEQNNNREQHWHLWGPYLSERQWGTVREDYSANGDAWNYFPHDHARSRAYRWGEDGIGGVSDFKQRLCFAFAFWNERDPILKERLFGLTGPQGNHGEDVKEISFLEDNTPTHSYMRMTYRYPQAEFPYDELVRRNAERSKMEPEFELWDTGVLREDRYFDITIEYAKAAEDDILIRATITNRGPEAASLHLLPTLWFRNTWSWGEDTRRPNIRVGSNHSEALGVFEASHDTLGEYRLVCEGAGPLLFTENETNVQAALRRAEPLAAREGRLPRGGRAGKRRRRKPGAHWNEGRGALPLLDRPVGIASGSAATAANQGTCDSCFRRFRSACRAATRGGGRVLRRARPDLPE